METIGIICEYNPFHNGHAYHINKIKEMYPDSLIVLVLNGYFLERGEISIISKEDKTKIALENNVDLVVELPFVFGSESADTFAEASTIILNYLNVNKLIFGSECNDIKLLRSIAEKQLDGSFSEKIKEALKEGVNYPTALNKSIGVSINTPNDLLAVSYIKSIIKNKLKIEAISIQRTSDYHDTTSNNEIISATNIRTKIKEGTDISNYTNYASYFKEINEDLLFKLIKTKIITDKDLNKYLTVDEGIENKLIKEINKSKDYEDFIFKIKSKRYTYNRIKRMLIHILIGLTKEDRKNMFVKYIKVLGFNSKGQKYLKSLNPSLPITSKISTDYKEEQYELIASQIYDLLTNSNTFKFEISNKPINRVEKIYNNL